MRLRNPLQPRHKFVYPRVVLHRAAAQRIHPQIDRVVPRREPREVANDLNLAQLRAAPQLPRAQPRPASSSASTAGTSSAASRYAFFPGADFSKLSPSFCVRCAVTLRVVPTNFSSVAISDPYRSAAAAGVCANDARRADQSVPASSAPSRTTSSRCPAPDTTSSARTPPIILCSSSRAFSCVGSLFRLQHKFVKPRRPSKQQASRPPPKSSRRNQPSPGSAAPAL